MTRLLDHHESFEPIEALVRAAGGYVLPSEDLRPRVLETARTVRSERRAQTRIGRFARWIVILAIFADAVGHQLQTHWPSVHDRSTLVDAQQVFSLVEMRVSPGHHDLGWGLVEAYSELRNRQAQFLRPAL